MLMFDRPLPTFSTISGLREAVECCDVILCDVFGTIQDQTGIIPGAAEALRRWKAAGRQVVLVSNTAAPRDVLARSLSDLDLPEGCYDCIVTSVDVARALIKDRGARRIHHIGQSQDRIALVGLDVRFSPIGDADLILCTSYPDDGVKAEDLVAAVAKGLDLMCTNPDTEVRVGSKILRFAGLVAARYAALGGRVVVTGKPDPSIYKAALACAETFGCETPKPSRVMAIGDSLKLDILGALDIGLCALWISNDRPQNIEEISGAARARCLPALIW